jgi:hypothetical protein
MDLSKNSCKKSCRSKRFEETSLMTDENKSSGNELEATPQQSPDERREFFKKCGKYAAYTAPAVAALLLFDKKKAHAVS